MITNLTTKQIESIQIDEGVIEFDGRHGKTTGTQVIEEQGASLKVTTLCMSQENLALAIPTCTIASDDGKTIKNPPTGVIGADKYLKNVTMFAKTIGGKY